MTLTEQFIRDKVEQNRDRCVLALLPLGIQVAAGKTRCKETVFTGFLIDVVGTWFWVTASHVREELSKVRGLEDVKFLFQCYFHGFADTVLWDPFSLPAYDVPALATKKGQQTKLCGEVPAYDICFFPLSRLYVENLKACGARPFVIDKYEIQSFLEGKKPEPVSTFLIGIPSSHHQLDEFGRIRNVTVFNSPVDIIEDRIDELRVVMTFTPKDKQEIEDARGMSGGAVVVVAPDRAFPIAVQSSQKSKGNASHTLFAARLDVWLDPLVQTAQYLRDKENSECSLARE